MAVGSVGNPQSVVLERFKPASASAPRDAAVEGWCLRLYFISPLWVGALCFLGRASAGSTYCCQAVGMDFPLNATEVRRARRERVKFFNDFDDGAGPSSARDRVRSHGRRAGGNNFIRTRVGHLARVVLHHGGFGKKGIQS